MSLEFLQRPNSDEGAAPVPVAEPQVNTTAAPIPVAEPTPAASVEEPVTTQKPNSSHDIATEESASAPATMSYASVAASGPQQSEEEKRAPAVPEVEHTEEDVHELIDVDSPHISSVPADFQSQEIQTETQAERERLEAEAHERAQQAKQSAQQAEKKAEKQAEEVKEKAEKKTEEVKEKASKKAEEVKEKAEEVTEKAKQKAQKATEKAKANSDNPVVIGNTVAVVALGGLLGFGAYRKYNAGQLTWKVAGAWAGVVGAFALGDYYASQFLFKKYPPKN